MKLLSVLLFGDNYLIWSRYIYIVLKIKDKLGFINSKYQIPAKTLLDFPKMDKGGQYSYLLNIGFNF